MPELTIPTTETPSTPAPPAPAPLAVEWSDEVKSTADYYGLTDYLPAAIRIIEESFPPGSVVRPYVQWEPEDGSRRVILDVRVPCGVAEAVERFQRLLDRWTVELPIHVRMNSSVTFCPM